MKKEVSKCQSIKVSGVKMVDVGSKPQTERLAKASCKVLMNANTLKMIKLGEISKGDVLSVAKVAGIMGAKKTHELIPLCHPLEITHVDIELKPAANSIEVTSTVKCAGKTGVEMEALTAVAVSALTIYDMCKPVDKDIIISDLMLLEKRGGKSGTYIRK